MKLFQSETTDLEIFEKEPTVRGSDKQQVYTLDATKLVELDLKNCLEGLVQFIFGCKF